MNLKKNTTCSTNHFFDAMKNPFVAANTDKLILVSDSNGCIIYSNHIFQSVSGYGKDELKNKKINFFLFHADELPDKKNNAPMNFSLLASDFNVKLYDAQGSLLPIKWSTTLLTNENGSTEYLAGIGSNCADHQNTLNCLEESRRRYQNLVKTVDDWVWETNANHVFVYSSPQVESILGYRPEEIVGKTVFDLMPDDEVKRLRLYFSQRDEKTPFCDLKNIKLHKNGRRVVMETRAIPNLSEKGALLGHSGITSDVTVRENMLRDLQQSKKRLYLSQKFARIANWDYDIKNDKIQCSEHICSMLGLPENHFSFSHENLLKCIHPDDLKLFVDSFYAAIKDGCNYRLEYRVIWPDGNIHWLKGEGYVINGADGKPSNLLGIMSNIDKYKNNEQAQKQYAKEQRNVLIREVHHRIKNNLQGIVGLLHNNLSDSEKRPKVAIGNAITQIRTIALIHGIQGQRNGDELSLCELIPAIIKSQVTSLKDRDSIGIDFINETKTPLQLIEQETVPVALILNELITNAVKYANQQQLKNVRVTLYSEKKQGKISIFCPGGCLPDGFDFQTGKGCSTGLELVRALLPSKGITIHYKQMQEGVLTHVFLINPVLLDI